MLPTFGGARNKDCASRKGRFESSGGGTAVVGAGNAGLPVSMSNGDMQGSEGQSGAPACLGAMYSLGGS